MSQSAFGRGRSNLGLIHYVAGHGRDLHHRVPVCGNSGMVRSVNNPTIVECKRCLAILAKMAASRSV